jgi:hypothetical protein
MNRELPGIAKRLKTGGQALMVLLAATFTAPVLAQDADETESVVSFRVEPAIVDLRKGESGTGLWLMATGLKAGQEAAVYVTMYGAESDISYMLTSEPKANKDGSFATSWEIRANRYSKVLADQLTFQLRDPKTLKVLATAPVALCLPVKGAEAPWCEASRPLLPIAKKKKKKKSKKKS